MRKIFSLLPYLLIFLSCQNHHTTNDVYIKKIIRGKVVKIADGDSFTLLTPENQQIRIRMFGIDSPEKGQAFYRKSKNNLSRYIFGKNVLVKIKDTDQYHRIVGMVYLNDSLNINLQMIKDGYAWHFKKYSSDKQMSLAEKKAKQQKLGLWADKHPVPPWEWRRTKRKSKIFH